MAEASHWPGATSPGETVVRLFLDIHGLEPETPVEFGHNIVIEQSQRRAALVVGEESLLRESPFLVECRGIHSHDALGALHSVVDSLLLVSDSEIKIRGSMVVEGSVEHASPSERGRSWAWGHHETVLTETAIHAAQQIVATLHKYRTPTKFNRLSNALHLYFSALYLSPDAALALFVAALEGLFSQGIQELSHRLALAVAFYLEPNGREARLQLYEKVKHLYTMRSKVVHGDKIDQDEENAAINLVEYIVPATEQLVRRCLRLVFERQHGDFISTTKRLDDFFIRLAIGYSIEDAIGEVRAGR